MPTYDYHCKACSSTFEAVKKIADRDNTTDLVCPECAGHGSIERQVGAPMFAYTVITKGDYGSNLGGFKDVLAKVHSRTVGSNLDKLSSYEVGKY